MPIRVTVSHTLAKQGQDAVLGAFDFLEIPRHGDIVTLTTRTQTGEAQVTEYQVDSVEHVVEAGQPPQVNV